jgi:hypothetical protein
MTKKQTAMLHALPENAVFIKIFGKKGQIMLLARHKKTRQ